MYESHVNWNWTPNLAIQTDAMHDTANRTCVGASRTAVLPSGSVRGGNFNCLITFLRRAILSLAITTRQQNPGLGTVPMGIIEVFLGWPHCTALTSPQPDVFVLMFSPPYEGICILCTL